MRRALETFVGLSHLRHDAAFIARLQREERLFEIALACMLTIVLGAGSYGAVFGIWRAPEAALYAAIKLPAVFLLGPGLRVRRVQIWAEVAPPTAGPRAVMETADNVGGRFVFHLPLAAHGLT